MVCTRHVGTGMCSGDELGVCVCDGLSDLPSVAGGVVVPLMLPEPIAPPRLGLEPVVLILLLPEMPMTPKPPRRRSNCDESQTALCMGAVEVVDHALASLAAATSSTVTSSVIVSQFDPRILPSYTLIPLFYAEKFLLLATQRGQQSYPSTLLKICP